MVYIYMFVVIEPGEGGAILFSKFFLAQVSPPPNFQKKTPGLAIVRPT